MGHGDSYYATEKIGFVNIFEDAWYESGMGLFSMSNPTDTWSIFGANQEPGAWSYVTSADWTPLSDGFGIFFDVHTGGPTDPTADYRWFSDPSLNRSANGIPVDVGYNHVITNLFSPNILSINLDDQLSVWADHDYADMVVVGFSEGIVSASPVPEPTTMVLFGAGIVGLFGTQRLQRTKK